MNKYYYNPKGPSGLKLAKGDDEIYIDCQPTDNSGQLLVTEDKLVKPITADTSTKENPIAKMFSQILGPFAEVIEGILITVMIVLIAKGIINFFTGDGSFTALFFMLLKVCLLAVIISMLSYVNADKNKKTA